MIEFNGLDIIVQHRMGDDSVRRALAATLSVPEVRVALVDDVMSAGSALRGTHAGLLGHGAVPVVVGALLVLGSAGADYFAERGLPVEAVARDDYEIWFPGACPLCASGTPLEDVAGSSPPS